MTIRESADHNRLADFESVQPCFSLNTIPVPGLTKIGDRIASGVSYHVSNSNPAMSTDLAIVARGLVGLEHSFDQHGGTNLATGHPRSGTGCRPTA